MNEKEQRFQVVICFNSNYTSFIYLETNRTGDWGCNESIRVFDWEDIYK